MDETVREFVKSAANLPQVRGFLHTPPAPSGDGIVLTHGAGANCESELLVAVARELCGLGITVLRCDLPFRQARPHGPPPRGSAEQDQLGLKAAITALSEHVGGRVCAGGHSYGGRQATLLAAAEPTLVERLLLLSYPLHPPKRPNELRTSHFPKLVTPSLFIQGTRDGFGTIEEMSAALRLIATRTELVVVPGCGHSLITRTNRGDIGRIVADAFAQFMCGGKGNDRLTRDGVDENPPTGE